MKYPALENHLCGMNDGECICNCFDEGFQKASQEIQLLIAKEMNIARSENEKTSRLASLFIEIDNLIK